MGKEVGAGSLRSPGASRREIKFRAWDPFNKRMYKAPFIAFECDGTYEAYDDSREWEDCIRRESILMQWTGLKDKHGRDIYEGDILKSLAGKRMAVRYCDGEFKASDGQVYIDRGAWFEREIVGNIFEGEALPEAASAGWPNPSNPGATQEGAQDPKEGGAA